MIKCADFLTIRYKFYPLCCKISKFSHDYILQGTDEHW